MPQVLLRIYFMDGGHKTVYVDPQTTTIEELWWQVAQKLSMSEQEASLFFIWQISSDLELLLYSDQTIQDAYDDWPHNVATYTARPTLMRSLSQSKLNRSPSALGLQRPQSLKDSINLTITSSPKMSGSPKSGRRGSLTPSDTLKASTPVAGDLHEADVEEFKLVFRPSVVVSLAVERTMTHPDVIHLLYSQAVHHVIISNYPCLKETAVTLAGVQLQVQLGDHKQEHKQFILENLSAFVPEHLIDRRSREEWVGELVENHLHHKGQDGAALKKLYVNTVQEWPFYGSTFFRVKAMAQESKQSFFKQDTTGSMVLGINHVGVHTIHARALKFETWKFQHLVLWDSTPTVFMFKALTGLKKDPERTYTCKTPQAELINDIMHDWAEEWEKEFERTEGKKSKTLRNKGGGKRRSTGSDKHANTTAR